jgi:hypothetical protein
MPWPESKSPWDRHPKEASDLPEAVTLEGVTRDWIELNSESLLRCTRETRCVAALRASARAFLTDAMDDNNLKR